MANNQSSIFDLLYSRYKISKPIRLIELFSGYGSQALALKYLNKEFKSWRTCEWALKSIQAYKDIHCVNDNNDYSQFLSKKNLEIILYHLGISSNYNNPMDFKQIKKLSEQNLRNIYNNIVCTCNMVNIQRVTGQDLHIVDKDKYNYILTYSFPCQDLSLAGKGKGMSDTSTRSGMLWEVERILSECKELGSLPQMLLMENVPQVHSVDNVKDFNKWQLRLEELGYKNYFQDLIATDYGIPQTRNRCFMVSILGDYSYTFPQPKPLTLKLKDMLEDNVDEKYYLSDKMLHYCFGVNQKDYKFPRKERFLQCLEQTNKKNIATTITTYAGNRPTDNYIVTKDTKNYIEWEEKGKIDMNCRAWKDDKVIATLNTGGETKILIKNATKKGYLEATDGDGIDLSNRMERHRGTVQKDKVQTLTTQCDRGVVVNMKTELCNNLIKDGKVKENDVIRHSYTSQRTKNWDKRNVEQNNVSPTLDTRCDCLGIVNNMRIRKLTPKECFRLMGVKDEDYEKVKKNQSNSSLYHLAGDSIVVNVLMAIFKEVL